ncbi:MAG: hypothetical protein WCG25_05495 [bacterium]
MQKYKLDLIIEAAREIEQEVGAADDLRSALFDIQSKKIGESAKEISFETLEEGLKTLTKIDGVAQSIIEKYEQILESYA